MNLLTDFFYLYGKLKSWSDCNLKEHKSITLKDYSLNHKLFFKWCQLIHAITKSWKKLIIDDKGNYRNIVILNHHLLKDKHIHSLEKLNAKELYPLSICFKKVLPLSQKYFENIFPDTSIKWRDAYIPPQLVTINSTLSIFHYKILNNELYLNKQLFCFWISNFKIMFIFLNVQLLKCYGKKTFLLS